MLSVCQWGRLPVSARPPQVRGGHERAVLAHRAAALPRSEARFYPEVGHVSLLFNRYEDILTGLLATAQREEGRPVRI